MSESFNICLACGLCCDGSIIGFVELDKKEIPELRDLIDIEEVGEKGVFFQPCKNLSCKGCKIYSQRPKHCIQFACKMLKAIESGELDFDAATEAIQEIIQKKIAIEKQLTTLHFELKSQSFYYKMLELKKMMGKDESGLFLQNHQQLMADLKEIDELVSKSFGISY